MSKVTARQQMEVWQAKCIEELMPLKMALDSVVRDLKTIRKTAKHILARTNMSREMSSKLSQGIEDRANAIHSSLVKELGQDEADDLIDSDEYPSTLEEDERDETTAALLDDFESPDPEDSVDSAIDSLEELEEAVSKLLGSFKKLK